MSTAPRRLAKARSEAIPRCSPRRMVETRSDSRILRKSGQLRFTRPLHALGKKPKRIHVQIQAAAAIAMVILLSSAVFRERRTPMNNAAVNVVKEKIARIRIERQKAITSPTPKPSFHSKRRRTRVGQQSELLQYGHHLRKFEQVERTFHMREVQLGTFPDARRIGITTIALLQPNANRFDTPWQLPSRVETLSFQASGNRILYSTLKQRSSDGLGRGLTVLNAELSTALNLGISYTHRVGIYGSLSEASTTAVEDIFGWGVGEVPRLFLEKEVCVIGLVSKQAFFEEGDHCPVCTALQNNVYVNRIVQIPARLSYGCVSCRTRQLEVEDFIGKWGGNNTLFQMALDKCDEHPKAPDFALSQRYLYWKYWDLHSNMSHGIMDKKYEKPEGSHWAIAHTKRAPVQLKEEELNIAVHARRGDFFFEKRRHMISSKVFTRIIRQAMRVVHTVGGVYAQMPVVILVYSEGYGAHNGDLHDHLSMNRDFHDSDGIVRTAPWFHRLLVGSSQVRGNMTHSCRTSSTLFPEGVRIEMRINNNVSLAFHEMASADIFIGSESDWSQYAVRMVSRAGLQLLPTYLGGGSGCCVVRFNERNGKVRKFRSAVEFWRLFAVANERSVWRAMQDWAEKNDDCADGTGPGEQDMSGMR